MTVRRRRRALALVLVLSVHWGEFSWLSWGEFPWLSWGEPPLACQTPRVGLGANARAAGLQLSAPPAQTEFNPPAHIGFVALQGPSRTHALPPRAQLPSAMCPCSCPIFALCARVLRLLFACGLPVLLLLLRLLVLCFRNSVQWFRG